MVILSCIFHRWLATTQRDFCGFILMVKLYCSHGVYPDEGQIREWKFNGENHYEISKICIPHKVLLPNGGVHYIGVSVYTCVC